MPFEAQVRHENKGKEIHQSTNQINKYVHQKRWRGRTIKTPSHYKNIVVFISNMYVHSLLTL